MAQRFHIRGVNFATGEAWLEASFPTVEQAQAKLEEFRPKRKHWKEDPVVYGIRRPQSETEEVQ